jgi:hypothetical protein
MPVTHIILISLTFLITSVACQATEVVDMPLITYITNPQESPFNHCHFDQAHKHAHCYLPDEVHVCDHEPQATPTVVYVQPATMIIQSRYSNVYGPVYPVYFGSLRDPYAAYDYSAGGYWGYPARTYPTWRYSVQSRAVRRHAVQKDSARQPIKGYAIRNHSSASRTSARQSAQYDAQERRSPNDHQRLDRYANNSHRDPQEPRTRPNTGHGEPSAERHEQAISRAEHQSQPMRQRPPRDKASRNHWQDSKRNRQRKDR